MRDVWQGCQRLNFYLFIYLILARKTKTVLYQSLISRNICEYSWITIISLAATTTITNYCYYYNFSEELLSPLLLLLKSISFDFWGLLLLYIYYLFIICYVLLARLAGNVVKICMRLNISNWGIMIIQRIGVLES